MKHHCSAKSEKANRPGGLRSTGQWDIQARVIVVCDEILFLKKTFLNSNQFAVMCAVFQHWTDGINVIH